MQSFKRSLVAGIIASLLLAAPVWAQETGSISGVVTDPDGAPLPGVAVTLQATLVPTSTVYTQANGVYRFPVLPADPNYVLTFTLEGFKQIIQTDIPVRVGGNSQINVAMELSAVEETVTVTGTTPVVDVKSTTIQNNVTEEYMQGIPSARDPWVMLEHTGMVQMDRQNIGGSEGGQQSSFVASGASFSDNVWTYDGAEVTDIRANGASPMYYDFDAFEEVSIQTGGNDPSVATGGIKINFVTKRGGNQWRGSGRFYLTDGGMQGCTVGDRNDDGTFAGTYCSGTSTDYFPNYIGNAINNIKDFGGEVGGPVIKDRFFVWGSYGKQDIKQYVGIAADNTQLANYHAKGNAHLTDNMVLQYTFIMAEKTKQGRGASATRPPATTWNQGGPSPVHTGKLQYTINDNNYVEASVNNTGLGFFLEPQGGRDVQVTYNYNGGLWGESYFYYDTDRPLWNVRVDGNTYVAGSDIDNELKYGYSYRHGGVYSDSGIGSQIIAVFSGASPVEAWLVQGGRVATTGIRHSFYVGDTLTAGRLVANLGVRYDIQTSTNDSVSVAASAVAPALFPAISTDPFDPGYGWNTFSPRIGLTYDLTGDGRTIARASWSLYGAQMNAGAFDSQNPLGYREADYDWFDLNNNSQVDPGELGGLLWTSSGWDPSNPAAATQNTISKTSSPKNMEFIAGLERELSRNFGVGVNFIYRRNSDFTWAIRKGDNAPGLWAPATQNVGGTQGTITVWEPTAARNPYTDYQQRPDYSTTFMGGELFLTKRLSDKWMANASLALSNPKVHYDSLLAVTDPTNVDRTNDRQFAAFGRNGSSGGAAAWSFKASGMYQLPMQFSVAGFFQARQGYIDAQGYLSNNRAFGAGRVTRLLEDFGDTKLDTYVNLDLRAEKVFDIGERGRVHLIADFFNVLNKGNILGRINDQRSTLYPRIREVTQGRTIRFGVRVVLR